MQSKGAAERNLKILEQMLEREPLKMFAVRGSLCYLSSKMSDQMDHLDKREGNEEELYKDDDAYQSQARMKQVRRPQTSHQSYFRQCLAQKAQEAKLQAAELAHERA